MQRQYGYFWTKSRIILAKKLLKQGTHKSDVANHFGVVTGNMMAALRKYGNFKDPNYIPRKKMVGAESAPEQPTLFETAHEEINAHIIKNLQEEIQMLQNDVKLLRKQNLQLQHKIDFLETPKETRFLLGTAQVRSESPAQ